MALLSDFVLDSALSVLDTDANRLDICSQEPVTYAEATSTYTLGNKVGIVVDPPEDAAPNGRSVTVVEITDGTVTATGTATHWSIVDTVNSRLLATGSLTTSQVVTNGNIFTTDDLMIRIPDAVDA